MGQCLLTPSIRAAPVLARGPGEEAGAAQREAAMRHVAEADALRREVADRDEELRCGPPPPLQTPRGHRRLRTGEWRSGIDGTYSKPPAWVVS